HQGHYPAIDVLQSVSRLVGEIMGPEVRAAGQEVRSLMAAFKDKRDLISIGAYEAGSDPLTDRAIAMRHPIEGFLRQSVEEASTAEQADEMLLALAAHAGGLAGGAAPMGDPMGEAADGVPGEFPAANPSAIPPLNLGV
ncbi:MAG: flagellum-specific ATP synthase FliI, partial [Baekduiaceae bacterium]